MDTRYRPDERLKRRREIDLVMRRGVKRTSRTLRLYALENGLGRARFAPVVPGRVCNAVKRNRWKRLLRETFRLNKAAFGARDVVVMPQVPPEKRTQADVARECLALLKAAR